MLTIEYAKDAAWNSNDGQQIFLIVKFAEFNTELPFTATSFDPMPYGVELYNRAKAGEFGAIAKFIDPTVAQEPQPTVEGAQTL